MDIEAGRLYTLDEVAAIFQVDKTTIYAWRRKGLLPFRKMRRKVYFLGSDILKALGEKT